ncbi:MAG TPA: hypothetical protein VM120_17380 [Bryobacteraceae bacterium]|nr:hypothetical protein [Bryobacteraceae bacterium]
MKLYLLLAAPLLFSQAPSPFRPSESEMKALRSSLENLPRPSGSDDLKADVGIYFKAADWIARHPEEFLTKAYYDNALKLIEVGRERARELSSGTPGWQERKGRVARAYRSKVDGSVQPYTVIVPGNYTRDHPMRLDVILHGKNARLNEVSFLADAEWGKPVIPQPDRIELIIYGRTNNGYRWAGETDVWEALAAAGRNYAIDKSKILLRGFSMGGAGAWHIGLHAPSRWAGIEAGAGFSDTRRYAKLENAPPHEQRVWPIYDAYLYARNALMVPTVGYGSIDDPQLQASVNVKEQLGAESVKVTDLRALFLVGPRIGHKFAPESRKVSEEFLTAALSQPRTHDHIRFLTFTTRYGECDWLTVDGLDQHYSRAEVDANREAGSIHVTTKGVTRLLFQQPLPIQIDGQSIGATAAVERINGKWQAAKKHDKHLRKRHGLQGPIDDAFLDAFLCVRPTAAPRDISAHRLAVARLDTFRENWDKFFRGDIRIKDDRDVSDEDIRNNNLILFGDAASNRLIARVLPKLPFRWETNKITIAGKTFPGENQLLVAIYPNPLNPDKYIVLNSGHTFGEKDLRGTNALLYPRLGDWAVLNSQGGVVTADFFNESWR